MKKSNRIKMCLIVICPFIILSIASVGYQQIKKLEKEPVVTKIESPTPSVSVQKVKFSSEILHIQSQGMLEPLYTTLLTSSVSGRIEMIDPQFNAGGIYKKGELLLQIDPTHYRALKARAAANLAEAELNLEKFSARATQAKRDWKRLGNGEGSRLALHIPQLRNAISLVDAAKAELEAANKDLQNTKVLAPYNCRVKSREISPGQSITAGDTLATVFSIDTAEIRLPIRDENLSYFQDNIWQEMNENNATIEVILSAEFDGSHHEWTGKVVRSEGVINSDNQMIYLIARIEDPYKQKSSYSKVSPMGLHVKAKITGKRKDNLIRIPSQAIVDNSAVLVIDDSNKLHKRQVKILLRDTETTLVESGLLPDERVCTSNLDYYVDGLQVKVHSEQLLAGGQNE